MSARWPRWRSRPRVSSSRRAASPAGAGRRWLLGRVLLPLGAVLFFPVTAVALALAGDLPAWGVAFFGAFFLAAMVLAFGRQAFVLLDHERAVRRERRLRHEAMRHS